MKLESLSELLNYLNPNKRESKRCLDAMKSLDSDLLKIKEYTNWNKSHYTRNLISKTEAFELMLCCWEPGQKSRLHDLNQQTGWIKIIKGDLNISTAKLHSNDKPVILGSKKYSVNDLFVQQAKKQMYSIENNSNERAISLHLYSLPISYYKVMNGSGTDVENLKTVYHSINGVRI